MQKEFDALMGNRTWAYENVPNNGHEISCKWIFKIKHDRDKQLLAKARCSVGLDLIP